MERDDSPDTALPCLLCFFSSCDSSCLKAGMMYICAVGSCVLVPVPAESSRVA